MASGDYKKIGNMAYEWPFGSTKLLPTGAGTSQHYARFNLVFGCHLILALVVDSVNNHLKPRFNRESR